MHWEHLSDAEAAAHVSEIPMSEACCPTTCVCQDWLTAFCDYAEITHTYCGEETSFSNARVRDMPQQDVSVEAGVHQADRQIEISMEEHNIESGIGAVVVDEDQQEWVVYRVQKIKAFCLLRLWARNITSCFALTDRVEVLELVPCESDCGPQVKERLIARLMAKVVIQGGTVQNRSNTVEMRTTAAMRLQKWPGRGHPEAFHRIRTTDGLFKIVRFRDPGPFAPFEVELEPADVHS